MASKGKSSGRVTAKGTRPPAKKAAGGPKARPNAPTGGSGGSGDGGSSGESTNRQMRRSKQAAEVPEPNRQMRRSGHVPEQQAQSPQAARAKMFLIAAAVVAVILVVTSIVLFRVSGVWVGLIGAAAGVATGFAVVTGKTFAATKGRPIAIGLVLFGVAVTAFGVFGPLDFHWPFAALIGCGVGAVFAELSVQQMTAPESPPTSAQALLKRSGAQHIPAPTTGECVWATQDGRIRIITGASVPDGIDQDKVLADKNVRKTRQRAAIVASRMRSMGVEPGIIVVVDSAIATIRDGDDIICSAAGLTKALNR